MSPVSHHIPEDIIEAYASGALPHGFSVVVATHLSLCDSCRAVAEACDALGGVALESLGAEAAGMTPDRALREKTLALLDAPRAVPEDPKPMGIFPAAVAAELGAKGPAWRSIGAGIRQQILVDGREGSARLLSIPGGKAVPDHGHNGLEMTLVLQGSFHDVTGRYARGDVQVVTDDLEHTPTADPGPDCICLAATDAPLRFSAMIPRLLQRYFRI
ncbi:transcriptional regulator [Oceanicola sp. D3]|uniref:ChrR family anti-sigma-E factor n=1 Tax=Oceanicola sp. D3 TaxID=2587163 RepID=UPI0011229C15|nr:ChrR family anti-sigma-E factor [Oceanicola sp. D3]QDC08573.1 transcriptional regulator [Oceanicola sp. D3]